MEVPSIRRLVIIQKLQSSHRYQPVPSGAGWKNGIIRAIELFRVGGCFSSLRFAFFLRAGDGSFRESNDRSLQPGGEEC